MSRFFLILLLVGCALLALFISAVNAGRVEIELAFARFTTPLGLALVIAFTIGLLAGLAWQIKWVAQLLAERGRLRRALRLAESKARKQAGT
jgi:uncharacterized integral membrane protein